MLSRKLGTSFAAARCQNGTASAGAHAKAETVLFGTTAVIRLKGPLAHCDTPERSWHALPLQQGGRTDRRNEVVVHPPCLPTAYNSAINRRYGGMRNADIKDYITLGHRTQGGQTDRLRHSARRPVNHVDNCRQPAAPAPYGHSRELPYPQARAQLSSVLFIVYCCRVAQLSTYCA